MRDLLMIGYKVGSIHTSLQTSDNQLPTVPQLIATDEREATFRARQSVFHSEVCLTGAISRVF